MSQLTELTQKQLQLSSPTPPQPTSQSSSSSLPGAKGGGGGGGESDRITVGEIVGLAVAIFSLAGEQCVQSDEEMTAWKVSSLFSAWLDPAWPSFSNYNFELGKGMWETQST